MTAPTSPRPDADYTVNQACERLSVSRTTIHDLIRAGKLESYKLGSSRRAGRRIRRESLEAFRRGGVS